MVVMEEPNGKPQILMKRTGSSRPLERSESPSIKDDRVVRLDGPETLNPWIEQTMRVAAGMNCLDALKIRNTIPRGTSPKTEPDWLRKLRIEIAQHIVLSRITPAVFAYMRVLGYNGICGKNAAETYEFAKLAAGRIHIPYNAGKQDVGPDQCPSEEEVDRMVWEWQFSKRESYPNEISYDLAMDWLGNMLQRRAETDEGLREILKSIEQQDRKRKKSEQMADSDVSEQPQRKRKSGDDEAESSDINASPCQSNKRQLKKPRSTETENDEPRGPRKEQMKAPEAQPEAKKSTRDPTPLDLELGEKSRIKSLDVVRKGATSPGQVFDTGLLSPRDLKSEPSDF
ncbi:hypothetical protein VM1G_00808 [Cytospora mali]|uniref:Uncharacterized protein n=1 Tax=Cytospora mali TaxID=578113 RepID=A0A194VMT7_CYTMA|nr:hypothetical protein VM1G_00808 [Valsa mali]